MATAHMLPDKAAQVLELVQQGRTAQEIAEALGTSRNAVYQHIGKLRKQGYLPNADGPEPQESVEDTIDSFITTLEQKLASIEARGASIEQELDQLHRDREAIVAHIERLRATA